MMFHTLLSLARADPPTTGFLDGLGMTDLLLAAGILLITISMLRFYKKKQGNQKDPKAAANETIERNRQLRGVRHDLETLMVEIEEYAKRMGAQLDAKSMRLEKLLDEADRKLQRLESRGLSPEAQLNATKMDGGSSDDQANPEPMPQPEATADPLAQTVLELADQGHDAQSIAQQLDEHVGKVELILALRQSAG